MLLSWDRDCVSEIMHYRHSRPRKVPILSVPFPFECAGKKECFFPLQGSLLAPLQATHTTPEEVQDLIWRHVQREKQDMWSLSSFWKPAVPRERPFSYPYQCRPLTLTCERASLKSSGVQCEVHMPADSSWILRFSFIHKRDDILVSHMPP